MTRVALLLHVSHVFIQYNGDCHACRTRPGDVAGDVPKWVASVTTTRTRPLPVRLRSPNAQVPPEGWLVIRRYSQVVTATD